MVKGFLNNLNAEEIGSCAGRSIWRLNEPLVYIGLDNRAINIPCGFETDLASVPRLPIIYGIWGDRAHRPAVLHDALYRSDFLDVSFSQANSLFLEAMELTGVSWSIRYPMYAAVCAAGWASFHKKKMGDKL